MKITTQVPYVHTPKNLSVKNDGAENLKKLLSMFTFIQRVHEYEILLIMMIYR